MICSAALEPYIGIISGTLSTLCACAICAVTGSVTVEGRCAGYGRVWGRSFRGFRLRTIWAHALASAIFSTEGPSGAPLISALLDDQTRRWLLTERRPSFFHLQRSHAHRRPASCNAFGRGDVCAGGENAVGAQDSDAGARISHASSIRNLGTWFRDGPRMASLTPRMNDSLR